MGVAPYFTQTPFYYAYGSSLERLEKLLNIASNALLCLIEAFNRNWKGIWPIRASGAKGYGAQWAKQTLG